jgi:NADH-quinone oxidoreductase subunit E
MLKVLEHIPVTDPLADPEQKALIDRIIEENENLPGAAMVILNETQNRIGHVSKSMQAYIANRLHIPQTEVKGITSFYSFFTMTPRGKHTAKFCMGTACYVGGAPQLLEKAKEVLGIEIGETTSDGLVTMEVCRCVGACSQAPVVMIDDDVKGRVKPNKLPVFLKSLK